MMTIFHWIMYAHCKSVSVMKRKTVFDVFSGIGGFALGLRQEFQTIAYCECDPMAVAVLHDNMKRKLIDAAPVYWDVSEVTKETLNRHKPFAITMGFPCQDVSGISTAPDGIQGSRTGLVFKVLDAVKDCKHVRVLLLENSPFIRVRGLDLLEQRLKKAGFHMSWMNMSAAECGAPHRRNRWWGVAYRSIADLSGLFASPQPKLQWPKEPEKRVVAKSSRSHTRGVRLQNSLLGNAIVPCCAYFAYHCIVQRIQGNPHVPLPKPKLPTLTLMYSDGHVLKKGWATPVFSPAGQCKFSTPRCNKLLENQVMYEQGTYKSVNTTIPYKNRGLHFSINPAWVEWLMGYPKGWTRCITRPSTSSGRQLQPPAGGLSYALWPFGMF
jgi:site-specific DNA-cytosine methylase